MEADRILRQDHAILRKKLTLLESAMHVAPEAKLVLREMGFSLGRLLREHFRREDQVFGHVRQRLSRVRDHEMTRQLLDTTNELLLGGAPASIPEVVGRLADSIRQLNEEMEDQEQEIFPQLRRADPPSQEELTPPISGAMSANEVMLRYPETEAIFVGLRVDRDQEGYDSIDELAWRHGIDPSEFLEELRQAASASPRI